PAGTGWAAAVRTWSRVTPGEGRVAPAGPRRVPFPDGHCRRAARYVGADQPDRLRLGDQPPAGLPVEPAGQGVGVPASQAEQLTVGLGPQHGTDQEGPDHPGAGLGVPLVQGPGDRRGLLQLPAAAHPVPTSARGATGSATAEAMSTRWSGPVNAPSGVTIVALPAPSWRARVTVSSPSAVTT